MKSKILTFLLVLGCCGFVFSQATDGVAECSAPDPSMIDPLAAPAVTEVCSDGSTAPPVTFAAPTSNLADIEFVVEVNGAISVINTDGAIDPTTLAVGDQVCVSAVAYSQAGVQQLLDDFQGLCALAEQFGQVPPGTCDAIYGPPLNGTITSLQDVINVAASFGVAVGSVADIVTAIDGINVQVGGFGLPPVCYATTAPVCYAIIDCAAACAVEADLMAAPAAPTVTESVCGADGATLEGGVVDPITCPAGSTAEYSIDAGATWAATVPAYDQTTAITVTVRCLCDEDMTTASPTAEVTTVPGMCMGGGAVCDAVAGEPLADAPTTICGGPDSPLVNLADVFAPGTGGYTDAAGVMDPVVTNYVAVDAAGNIVSVANSSAMIDLSALADGDQVCIRQLVYTQALLDDVTAFLDANICGLDPTGTIDGLLGCPLGMVELAPILDGLNNAFGPLSDQFVCDFLDNQVINLGNDPTCIPFVGCAIEAALSALGADVVDNEMIEIDLAALGLDLCAAKSSQYCVMVDAALCTTAVCEADAPELDAATGDCAADDGDMMETPFTWPLSMASTENTTAPYITEYIVTDAATGTIIGVFSTLAAAEAAANTEITGGVDGDATACIQPINHDSANLEALIVDIDAQSGGLICGVLPCPVSTLEAFYTAALGLGAVLDVATVVSIVGPPNVGATGLDLGVALGLPPGVLVVDVPPFCYELGVEVCATNAPCAMMCDPAIAAATAPPAVVSPESTCEADGMTLSGGVIAAPATACPTGSTLEYSIDAGATWSATLPMYDQMNAVTVDTRCVCDIDATVVSLTGSVTTVPGMCTATCDPAIAAATAPAVVITSESTCADGMTLSGGALADATGCPMGSMVQYSVDGGAFSTTLPPYNQTTSETITTQCVCTSDAAVVSMPTDVTTTPGVCAAMCSISVTISNYACDDGGTPDDPADDMVTFDYTVLDNNGTGTTWSSDQGDAAAAYGTTIMAGPFPADGTVWMIMVNDDGDTTCTSSASQSLMDCAPVENIPTVGEWGLIILGLLMSITAIVGIRQRREEEAYS